MPEKLFNCRRCNTPIVLDESLLRLTPAQLNLIINRNHNHVDDTSNQEILDDLNAQDFIPSDRFKVLHQAQDQAGAPIHYHDMLQSEDDVDEDEDEADIALDRNEPDKSSFSANSYVVLSDGEDDDQNDQITPNDKSNTISSRIKTLNKIFEILSQNQEIEHPLSDDCASLLIENYKLKFDQSQKEKDRYLSFLKKLKDRDNQLNLLDDQTKDYSQDLDVKLEESINEYNKLSQIETEKLDELRQLEKTGLELQEQLKSSKQELKELNENELGSILKLKNKLQLDLDRQYNKLEQSKSAYKLHLNHLDKLRNLNIYNKIFEISFGKDDKYGSINGFRLGYKVIWPELNSALGQVAHLLYFLIKRLELEMPEYKIVPMGSQSQIIKYVDGEDLDQRTKTVLNLYSSNEFSLGKLFNYNKLDVSMIALLNIVSQVEHKLISIDGEFELPYRISLRKGTVGSKSIRVSSNSEWTQSCKFLLTDLNWILAYTSVHKGVVATG
ncbi:APG6-domain-containing protein [Suhomyces tanzawaensis NRRL Y-17324]|uniref:APG6-domain-containing protein n=1 Tax=Suhomyces tanzawaensis NRRL Y-17324 TaxID=984487 RepID=A0A1E4SHQ7_9ASCO|nr:APG6-domain-containing protein [Suhomyces tanzawaensis NRRL Y-17324]ODV78962.1 APG6-domain-containing protein [Suhomyces tanzawaensis NRRL Y-17324]